MNLFFKRLIDLVFSLILIIAVLPFLLLIAVLIKLDSKGSVFFVQARAGLFGKPFNIYKFRTMVPDAINLGDGVHVSRNDIRITRAGSFLREWSLDELLQLINVVKGDMSFIGPRPTLMYQVERYNEEQRKRLNMRPGMTGLAQVNGRNNLSWPEKIEYDVYYVKNYSLWLDFGILLKTFVVLLKREGTYSNKHKEANRGTKTLYPKLP